MILRNFRLRYPQGVELVGLGHNWDLHNFVDLTAVRCDAIEGRCEFEWRASPVRNAWGDPSNAFAGCRLQFSGLSCLKVDGTFAQVGDVLTEIGTVSPDGRAEPFDMWLTFENRCLLKIAGEEAKIIPIDRCD